MENLESTRFQTDLNTSCFFIYILNKREKNRYDGHLDERIMVNNTILRSMYISYLYYTFCSRKNLYSTHVYFKTVFRAYPMFMLVWFVCLLFGFMFCTYFACLLHCLFIPCFAFLALIIVHPYLQTFGHFTSLPCKNN